MNSRPNSSSSWRNAGIKNSNPKNKCSTTTSTTFWQRMLLRPKLDSLILLMDLQKNWKLKDLTKIQWLEFSNRNKNMKVLSVSTSTIQRLKPAERSLSRKKLRSKKLARLDWLLSERKSLSKSWSISKNPWCSNATLNRLDCARRSIDLQASWKSKNYLRKRRSLKRTSLSKIGRKDNLSMASRTSTKTRSPC